MLPNATTLFLVLAVLPMVATWPAHAAALDAQASAKYKIIQPVETTPAGDAGDAARHRAELRRQREARDRAEFERAAAARREQEQQRRDARESRMQARAQSRSAEARQREESRQLRATHRAEAAQRPQLAASAPRAALVPPKNMVPAR